MSSQTLTLGQAIDKGAGIKIVGEPLFYEPLSVAFDKEAELDQASLVAAVSDDRRRHARRRHPQRTVDGVVRRRPAR